MKNKRKQSSMGIVSMVLGIIGFIIISFVTECLYVGIVFSVIGIVLAIPALWSKDKAYGTAVAGLVCSAIGIVAFLATISDSTATDADKTNGNENTEISLEEDENSEAHNMIEENQIENQESEVSEVEVEEIEILFRDIPWATSFPEVDEKLGSWELWNASGESCKTCSVDDILLGDYKGIDFEYGGINVIAIATKGEQEVAGYTTSGIQLYFAYLPIGDYLTYEEKDTALYGAQYQFEPTNSEEMYADLTEKLESLYGSPDKVTEDTDLWDNKYTYTYWYGANDTEIVLRRLDSTNDTTGLYKDEIYLTYAWRNGDELLQNASDAVKQEKADAERDVQGNGNVNGL